MSRSFGELVSLHPKSEERNGCTHSCAQLDPPLLHSLRSLRRLRMVTPTLGWTVSVRAMKVVPSNIPTVQPDLDSLSLRLSSWIILDSFTLAIKTYLHSGHSYNAIFRRWRQEESRVQSCLLT